MIKALQLICVVAPAFAFLGGGCASPTANPTEIKPSTDPVEIKPSTGPCPPWVDSPQSFYKKPNPDMVLGVGSSPILYGDRTDSQRAEQNAMHSAAMIATANLAMALGPTSITRTTSSAEMRKRLESISKKSTERRAGSGDVETFVHARTDSVVRKPQLLAAWKSPEGMIFVLVGEKKSDNRERERQ